MTDDEYEGPSPVEGADPAGEAIAIVGLAARVPGAMDARRFWRNLVDGVEAVTVFTDEEQLARGVSPEELADPGFVRAAPVLEQIEYFDAALFGMSAREAELVDPQQRMFLEIAHSALVDAACDPARFDGSIAVYAASGVDDYLWRNVRANAKHAPSADGLIASVGNHADYIATSVSYRLGLRGPSMTVHTACSSSLVAVHLACEALRNGECAAAVAGGVNIELPHGRGYPSAEGYTAGDGHCRPFDAAAGGTIWGSGAGAVVLKRLSDALADRDTIRGLILGNAVNNDGSEKVGFSAPSVRGQAGAISQAVGMAGVDPRSVGYVEAHGTGTALGDPIEVAGLGAVYGQGREETGWCGIGSVKGNIGHLSQAAGIVGLLKATMALENGLMPPSINFERANPEIGFDASPFYVVSTPRRWVREGGPRRAGVSAFGIGGTNAHLVLQEAPEPAAAGAGGAGPRLLTISAHTATALDLLAHSLADRLTAPDAPSLEDAAYTLRAGWPAHRHRAFVVAQDAQSAAQALRKAKTRGEAEAPQEAPGLAFLFPGQGSQYGGMAQGLYAAEPVFAAAVDQCLAVLDGAEHEGLGAQLRSLLMPGGDAAAVAAAHAELQRTHLTQPALFVVEYALAVLWRSWGVQPAAMIGHSIGEYVAATLAGVFELADAVRLVAVRGRLMGTLPAGAMLAVQRDESEVVPLLPEGVSVATVNGPGTCVLGGPVEAVEAFAAVLKEQGVTAKLLRTSHAFHTAMMEPVLEEYRAAVAGVALASPTVPMISNVTGDWLTAEQATDPGYWASQLREPVRFGAGLGRVLAEGSWLLVECGPGRQLSGLARLQLPRGTSANAPAPVPCLPGIGDPTDPVRMLLTAVGRLWTAGIGVDAELFGTPGRRVPLVGFPYERVKHWIEPDAPLGVGAMSTGLIAGTLPRGSAAPVFRGPRPPAEWYAEPAWRQAERLLPPASFADEGGAAERFVAFVDGPQGAEIAAALRARGASVAEVRPGTEFARGAEGAAWSVRPGEAADYEALLSSLAEQAGGVPARFLHAWALDAQPCGTDVDAAWAAQERGFFSVLWLVQALAAAESTAVRLDLLHAGAENVLGDELTMPEYATLAGISRVVPVESAELTVRRIDLEPGTAAAAAGAVLAELAAGDERRGEVVALRRGRRWLLDYTDVVLPEPEGVPLREGGRYVITGGTGGIGITLAEDLAERVPGVQLVLTARTALPAREAWDEYLAAHPAEERGARAITAVRRMEAKGARVTVAAVDATDRAAVRRLAAHLAEAGGLDGIVHAAGLAGGGVAEIKDRAAAAAVLAPKLAGTLALAAELGPLTRDFFVLCSSITAVAGGFGQVDYCAANAFLDAFAASAHRVVAPGCRVLSLDWGAWAEIGMAVETQAPAILGGARHRRFDHPLLSARSDRADAVEFSGRLSRAEHWVLDEHLLSGVPTVPGTAHLEAARAAVAALAPAGEGEAPLVALQDVTFLEPLRVPGSATLRVTVTEEKGADPRSRTFRFSNASGNLTHAVGTAALVPAEQAGPAPRHDLAAILGRCAPAQRRWFDPEHPGPLVFGRHWEILGRSWEGEAELVAELELPEELRGEDARWVLHPALLDVAAGFIAEGPSLPFGYGRILVRGPLPAKVYSHARLHPKQEGVIVADVSLLAEDGTELVSVTEFTLRTVDFSALGDGEQPEAAEQSPSDGERSGAISPREGADALWRVLSAGLGPQVVITPKSVAEITAGARSLGEELTADGAAPGAAVHRDTSTPEGLAATIAAIWAAVLDLPEVGLDDDFFQIGGTSLVAVSLITKLRTAVGVRLPMRVLFEAPTVAQMAARVEQLRNNAVAEAAAAAAPQAAAPEAAAAAASTTIPRLTRS